MCEPSSTCVRRALRGLFGLWLMALFELSCFAEVDLDHWQWRNPLPQGNALTGVASNGNRFVAVGLAGTILTSEDGVDWVRQASGTTNEIEDVTWNGSQFVAVGGDGTYDAANTGMILTSPDGVNWASRHSGTSNGLNSVVWGQDQFVAVGKFGTIITSADGVNWLRRNSGATESLSGAAWSGNRFVAVGGGAILTSPDGVSWARVSWNGFDRPSAVAWGGKQFVGVGANGVVLTSVDGLNWVKRVSSTTESLTDIRWNGREFIAVGRGVIVASTDGANWANRASNTGEWLNASSWSGTNWVTVGECGAIRMSADGIAWISRNSGIVENFNATTWGSDQFVVVGARGAISTSADGKSWIRRSSGTSEWLNGVTRGGSQFVTVGENGTIVTSLDGVNWTSQKSGTAEMLDDVTWGAGQFVAVGSTETILTSPDGKIWTRRTSSTPYYPYRFSGVAWNGSRFVVVGSPSGRILSSPDGVNWTNHTTSFDYYLVKVTWTGTEFVAVGSGYLGVGVVLTSPDGEKWTSRDTDGTYLIEAVTSNGSQTVAACRDGTLLTSTDGVNWRRRSSGSVEWLTGAAWGGGQFLLVGGNGTILAANGQAVAASIRTQPQSQAAVAGGAVSFSVKVAGTGPFSYQWQFNGQDLPGANGDTLNLRNLQAGHTGNYTVRIGNGVNVVTSAVATLTVQLPSHPQIDLNNWSMRYSERLSVHELRGATWGGGQFVAVGYPGAILTSPDGVAWTKRNSNTTALLNSVVWNGHQFVAVGDKILTSPDGVTWTLRASEIAASLSAVVWGRDKFVAVGFGGKIVSSPDGVNWTAHYGTTDWLHDVIWNGRQFVAVGDYGKILTSPDGVSWTIRSSGDALSALYGVAWSGRQFVAVGRDFGRLMVSLDGIDWTYRYMGTPEWLTGIKWTGSEFVALGERAILTSLDGINWTRHAVGGGPNSGMAWSQNVVTVVDSSGEIWATAITANLPPKVTAQPQGRTIGIGASTSFSVRAEATSSIGYQWRHNGSPIPGATGATLTLTNVRLSDTGNYDVVVSANQNRVTSEMVTLGISTIGKVFGSGLEIAANTPHPNGKVFDQVLLTGEAEAITADWTIGQITRTSFVDLDDDIVQVELSGPGTLAVVLDDFSGPARPVNYNQEVDYMKGHAGIVVTGADERTNVSVFTVGRLTAFDSTGAYNILLSVSSANNPKNNGSPLFQGHASTNYDGIADIAFIAISSMNGKFGGVRTANAHYFARKGLAGLYAPEIAFEGPIYVGDITAFDSAAPVLVTKSAADVHITGGSLLQDNGLPLKIAGIAQLRFVDGIDSRGVALPAQANEASLQQDGIDVTDVLVVNPAP